MTRTVGDVPSWDLETVNDRASLLSAIEVMFEKDYSQIGIERDGAVIGMVSYKSISRVISIERAVGADNNLPGRTVAIAMEEADPIVDATEDIVTLFELLSESPYVLVREGDGADLQILTNYDLLHYLRDSIEPFLLIEDIERSVRRLIETAFPDELDQELQAFFEDMEIRTPHSITDCSFGHYPQFMAHNWPRFDDYFEENGEFVRRLLDEVGDIRNKVFHFRVDSYGSDLEEELLVFAHGYFRGRVPDAA